MRRIMLSLVALLVLGSASVGLQPGTAGARTRPVAPAATTYGIEFVSTAATGLDMNDVGDVVGTSYRDTGCGSSCLPPQDTVVWRDRARIVLPGLPGRTVLQVAGMNSAAWVVGSASPVIPGIDDHAVVWKPVGAAYQAIDLGVLPDTTMSVATGIDDANRVVGYSTTKFFPPVTKSFLWTEAGGLVDQTALGFPETPVAISPGGTVATAGFWYVLGDLGSVTALAAPPSGFLMQPFPTAVNDAGDQARFLVSVNGENLVYANRYHHEGTWQQLSSIPTGHLSSYGVGGITGAGDISVTVAGAGMIAFGPDGLAQSLAPMLSGAYGISAVTTGGPINASGEILMRGIIGQSSRLLRMVPISGCATGCARVTGLQMRGKFIDDPNDPGECTPTAVDLALAKITVTDEAGRKLRGVSVTGHFMDDYWLNETVTGTTSRQGVVKFTHQGPACVGAIAFLVTDAGRTGRTFDRTTGTLAGFVIPQP